MNIYIPLVCFEINTALMYMQVGMLNLRDHCACVAPQLVLLQWWLQAWWLLWWLVSYTVLFNSPFTLNDNNLLHCRFYTNQLWDECKAQCRTRNNTGSGTITFYFYVDNISNCPDVCYIYQFLLISHCKCIGSFLIYSHSLHSDLNRKLHTFMQVDIGISGKIYHQHIHSTLLWQFSSTLLH